MAAITGNNEFNNINEMERLLNEIRLPNLDWIERLDINLQTPNLTITDIEDELKLESLIQGYALAAAKTATKLLGERKVPLERPADFLAEMVKSDRHMARVKSRAVKETKAIDVVHSRRSRNKDRKFNKKVKAKTIQSAMENRKDAVDTIDNWKKSGLKSMKGLDKELKNLQNEKRKEKSTRSKQKSKSKKFKKKKPKRLGKSRRKRK